MSGYEGDERTLNVEPGGSLEDIKRAYRELAYIWRPDGPPDDHKRRKPLRQSGPVSSLPLKLPSARSSTSRTDATTTDSGRSTRVAKKLPWLMAVVAIAVFVIGFIVALAVRLHKQEPVTQSQPFPSPTALPESAVQSLPDNSIEFEPKNSLASAHPYELPKPGDPLYDPLNEADVKAGKMIRQYRRGVFAGYASVRAAQPASTPAATATATVPELSQAGKTQFARYTNTKYKFSAAVPSNVFVKTETPSSNDRALFVSEDGRTKLLLLGKANPPGRTLAKIYSEWATEHTLKDPGKVVDYKVLRDGWFVVSGNDGPRGFYVKGVLRQQTLLLMCLEYDEQNCPLSGQDIGTMARSFDGK